jgi:hypothetical protein
MLLVLGFPEKLLQEKKRFSLENQRILSSLPSGFTPTAVHLEMGNLIGCELLWM